MTSTTAATGSAGGSRQLRAVLGGMAAWLPRGVALPQRVWDARHRWVVGTLAVATVLIPPFALLRGYSVGHSLGEAAAPTLLVVLALIGRLGRTVRASAASLGLMVVAGTAVHLSGGTIEAHFLYFVAVPIVALYESWAPFLLAIGFVLVQHGVIGTLESHDVYNHTSAQQHPWLWAAIHAVLFAAACVGALVNWRLHEKARRVESDLSGALAHQAFHDQLTGLPNRTQFTERAERALAGYVNGAQPPTVLLLDLDGFKDVNDTLGHQHGDHLLVQVAERLRSTLRGNDLIARIGGDEFAVLLEDTSVIGGEEVARRIAEMLETTFVVDGVSLDIEASIGVTTAERGQDVREMLRHADTAMYTAKENRLGTVRYDPGQAENHATRFALIGGMRRALEEGEIVLHYQPKITVDTGDTMGVEALARWEHPTRGLLSPAEFIPVLEKTSLCHRFTAYVIEHALAQTRTWLDQGLRLPVAVNVSTRSLLDHSFPTLVARQLAAAGVPGELLCIEITENTIMADPTQAIDSLRRLRELGVRTAIDDFGTGYSSMAYLKILPVDELKVDRTFVRDMTADPSNATLVQSAVDLGHNLGLSVVAEGVEDGPALTLLHQLGTDTAQGFYFAKPLPPDELRAWLEQTSREMPATARAPAE